MREIKFRADYAINENTRSQFYYVCTEKPHYKQLGYVMRKVRNHPFANKRGYVAEHRLVMEKHLGRFLSSWEKIHHRDQIRDNNELSNLELFGHQTKHAKKHSEGKRNSHGQFVCKEPIFSELKFRLYNTDTKTTYIYTLATLIGTTFRRGCFQFRGRFTGLHDKNGKEIYGGDICKWFSIINDNDIDEQYIEPIKFCNGAFTFKGVPMYEWFQEDTGKCMLEVISNIWENKELLNENRK